MTKGQGTGKICSQYQGFVMSRLFFTYFTINGVKKIIGYTEAIVMYRFIISRLHRTNEPPCVTNSCKWAPLIHMYVLATTTTSEPDSFTVFHCFYSQARSSVPPKIRLTTTDQPWLWPLVRDSLDPWWGLFICLMNYTTPTTQRTFTDNMELHA